MKPWTWLFNASTACSKPLKTTDFGGKRVAGGSVRGPFFLLGFRTTARGYSSRPRATTHSLVRTNATTAAERAVPVRSPESTPLAVDPLSVRIAAVRLAAADGRTG